MKKTVSLVSRGGELNSCQYVQRIDSMEEGDKIRARAYDVS
jgi:hypothetical protein